MANVELISGEWPVVRPEGEIDFSNVAPFDEALDAAVRESPKGFVVDLASVSYFDSAGVRSVLHAYTRIHEAGGILALVVNTRNVMMLLEALNLDRAPGMAIRATLDEACRALSESGS